jgi:amino acid adenylation domain-containing protein
MIKNENTNTRTGMEIAVIGMSGRFPGAKNLHEYWDNLKNGVESISFFSDEELAKAGIDEEILKDPDYIKAHGNLQDKKLFDASFFGYSPREAELMNPQIRIFHECAWEALEDAGYNPGTYSERIGLFAGASSGFHWEARSHLSGKSSEYGGFASSQFIDKDYLCSRVAYNLNLKGGTSFVQTACSTSLVAIHQACRALLTGESEMVLAGGSSIITIPGQGYLYQEGMIASPDGHCRAFAGNSAGTIGGEGSGIVVLKRLKPALRDRDNIYAIIRGTAINNDGNRKMGFTAPSVEAQAEVIRTAQRMTRVDPETITYVEAHGTGTNLGDPVEIEALKLAFNTDKRNYCGIGSVKSNFGHLDAAAGVAGFIKTVLALKHKLIPPSLHLETPNPAIDFKNSPFYVNTTLKKWQGNGDPLRAGVSSFGIGGTNAHVVLEQAPVIGHSSLVIGEKRKEREYQLMLLSARTETALEKMTENLARYFKQEPGINLADAAYTLQVGRKTFPYRRMLVCSTIEQTIAALTSPASGMLHNYHWKPGDKERDVIFMFPGQGAQYVNMGLELYQTETIFREEIDRCFEILNGLLDYDIKEILYPFHRSNRSDTSYKSYKSHINRTEVAQPILFAFEYALAKLLMKWGITPRAMIGHSIGEYTAACLSGVFSLEDALKLVVLRGRLMQQMPPGAMLGVQLAKEDLIPLLNDELSLAAVNTPSFCVVSGPAEIIHAFADRLKQKEHSCRLLHTSHAFHSKMMEPILQEFEAQVGKIAVNKPGIPYISNVTGNRATVEEAASSKYWANHIRETVQFSDGLKELLEKSQAIFVEVGPGNVLSTFVRQHPHKKENHFILNLTRHPKKDVSDRYYLLNKIGELWLYGIKIDWETFHAAENMAPGRITLPTYPFERLRYWIDGSLHDHFMQKSAAAQSPANALPVKKTDMTDWFYVPSWKRSLLQDHRQNNTKDNDDNDHHISEHWHAVRYNWLVFIDNECGIGSLFVEGLRQQGHNVRIVTAGKLFAKPGNGDGAYTLNPDQTSHYDALFQELSLLEKKPDRIVHFWSLTREHSRELTVEEFKKTQKFGFYSIINLVQAMDRQDLSHRFQLDVVTNHTQEVVGGEQLSPQKATMLGPIKVIPQEYPNIRCRCLDVLLPGPGSLQEENLVRQLLEECSGKSPDTIVAYRSNFRWVQTFEPVRLKSNEHHAHRKHEPLAGHSLREGGVYLVTGGLGNIGFILAEYIAGNAKARLILVGRSPFLPAEEWQRWLNRHDREEPVSAKIRKLQKLRQLGAEVLVAQADAGNQQQMKEVIHRAEERFGPINGVIHAAGITQGRSFSTAAEIKPPECEQQFQAKVYGLLVLEKLFRHKTLDFCFLMSSLSAVLGGLGFVAYAAANHFMDLFVQWYNRNSRTRWISVDWDGWQSGETAAEARGRLHVTPGEGQQAFQRILSSTKANLYVQTAGDLQTRINRWIKLETLEEEAISREDEKSDLYPRPQLLTPYVPPAAGSQQVIAGIWRKLFGFDKIGIRDDFFELGGDSLKAITVISSIHKHLNAQVPLKDFFNKPCIEKLAEYIDDTKKTRYTSIRSAEKKEYYPLSAAQKRLYILQQIDKKGTVYNGPHVFIMTSKLDRRKVENTFLRLIQRHESFRTSIGMKGKLPVQMVRESGDIRFAIEYYGMEGDPGTVVKNFIRPFDLSQPPFLRAGLIKTGTRQHILMIDIHHIVMDGVSHEIFANEFLTFYSGEEPAPLRVRYKDYSEWQNSPRQQAALAAQEAYWLAQFQTGDDIPVLSLPTDYTRPPVQTFAGRHLEFALAKKETQALKTVAQKEKATLYLVLLAIYYILMYKLSSQEEIVIGTPVVGRRHADLEPVMGIFINTLPLKNYPAAGKTVNAFLKELKEKTLEAFENQDYPFEDLVEKVALTRDISRNPLFDVMFVLQNNPVQPEIPEEPGMMDLELKSYHFDDTTSKFDLTLEAVETGRGLEFVFEYSTRLFKQETIQRFTSYFRKITAAVIMGRQQKISQIDILSEEEKHRLLEDFNRRQREYPAGKTIHQLFEEQVVRTPANIAILGPNPGTTAARQLEKFMSSDLKKPTIQLTYKELNENSNRLAYLLKEKGIKPDTIVAIMSKRTVEMVIGILGILKAGGAYLPIEREYPGERIKYMLTDSRAKVLLAASGTRVKVKVEERSIEIIDISNLSSFSISTPTLDSTSTNYVSTANLAYVIYTSGSTGRPKGVMIRHRSVVTLCYWHQGNYEITAADHATLYAGFGFDASVWELFPYLLVGAGLYMVEESLRLDIEKLNRFFQCCHITIAFLPTQLCEQFISRDNIASSLRMLLTGGDKLRTFTPRGYRLYNNYGPTENTVVTTACRVEAFSENIPVGKPIANSCVYILDKKSYQLQPPSIPGELCISGDGLARGYLNQPELTNDKFLILNDKLKMKNGRDVSQTGAIQSCSHASTRLSPHHSPHYPITPLPHLIIYRTGDLARWLPEGNIEFLGRIDNQVKVRGFRIELGEIENKLLKHDHIKEAVVTAGEATGALGDVNEGRDVYLCAYYVSDREFTVNALKEFLLMHLPDYMIPAYFVKMEKIPLTTSGKLDRKSLPLPLADGSLPKLDVIYVAPKTDNEKVIAETWAEVLNIERVGIHDNFFDIGGNSLKLIQVNNILMNVLKRDIPLMKMFEYPTINSFLAYLARDEREDDWVNQEIEQLDLKHDNAASILEETLQTLKEE